MIAKLKQWLGRPAFLPLLCYVAALIVWLGGSVWSLGMDTIAKAGGSLYQCELTLENFELVDMQLLEDGSYITTSGDPQMIWHNTDGMTVRTLRLTASFDRSPREMCLYYTNAEGEPFSVNKRVFAAQQDDGSYVYTLPQGRIAALRLDPCSPEEGKPVTMTFSGFSMNEPAGLVSYFAPGWYGAMELVLYPGLCACALSLAQSAWQTYQAKKKR